MAITVTPQPIVTPSDYWINKVKVTWTSDGSGNASGPLSLYGYLLKVTTDPTGAPTALYDITLVDADGSTAALDALAGLLIDRSGTVPETKYATAAGNSVPIFLGGTYTFTVANAGATKSGVAYFYTVDDL